MKLELSHLNVEDHLLFILASDGSKHRGIIKLHLKNCTRITDKGIVALESCKRIRHLDVSNSNPRPGAAGTSNTEFPSSGVSSIYIGIARSSRY